MRKITYKLVFSKYHKFLSNRLSECTYHLYKFIRPKTIKIIPLKGSEEHHFDSHRVYSPIIQMPMGFNYETQKEEEGFVYPIYVELMDYLPKEEVSDFKKRVLRFIHQNEIPRFSSYRTEEDMQRLEKMESYMDFGASTNLCTVELKHNSMLRKYAPIIDIDIMNLSTSFLAIRFRFIISKEYRGVFNQICKNEQQPFKSFSKPINASWYKPWRFSSTEYSMSYVKEKEIYSSISHLKWEMYCELKKYFHIHFSDFLLFPPSFDTFRTNIRPANDNKNFGFWHCLSIGANSDYSPQYNTCLSWEYEESTHEGQRLLLLCGGNYGKEDFCTQEAEYLLSDEYVVYLVASAFLTISQSVLKHNNPMISKAIRSHRTTSLLKTRVKTRENLYYPYRFMSEFTGTALEWNDVSMFHSIFSSSSWSLRAQQNIYEKTKDLKQKTDDLLAVMDNIADYKEAKSNMSLQKWMMLVTILSLLVAFFSIDKKALMDFVNCICEHFRSWISIIKELLHK